MEKIKLYNSGKKPVIVGHGPHGSFIVIQPRKTLLVEKEQAEKLMKINKNVYESVTTTVTHTLQHTQRNDKKKNKSESKKDEGDVFEPYDFDNTEDLE